MIVLKTVMIGSGSWGTVLIQVPIDNAREAVLWRRNPKEIDDINLRYQGTRSFPDVALHESLRAVCDLNVVRDANLLMLSVPTITVEELCIETGMPVEKPIIVVNTSKRFHPQTNERMSNAIRCFTPEDKLENVVSLIDFNHVEEAILRMLTTICAVSLCGEGARSVQELLSNEYLRVYRGDDEAGSEIDIILKNTIAVASGVPSDVGYGDNIKAVLTTRGLAGIIRYGVTPGGRTEAFTGLTGIGDLIAMCTSVHSCSFQAGYEAGTHNSARYFWENDIRIVESIRTAKTVYEVAKQKQIDMPIMEEIYRVLYGDKKPQQSARDLMLCDLKYEMR